MAKRSKSLNSVPFVPVIAALFGLVAGVLILATPQWLFERGVVVSGLPGLVSAAQPPLGDTARILSAILVTLLVAGLLWMGLMPLRTLLKPKLVKPRGTRIEPISPIAPVDSARRPIFATDDLGAPFMSDEAIAHARDELILETPLEDLPPETETIEAEAQAEDIVQPEDAIEWPLPVPEPDVEPVSKAIHAVPAIPDDGSIASMLDRLEHALERREQRLGDTAPFPGDMASLRKALGVSGRHG